MFVKTASVMDVKQLYMDFKFTPVAHIWAFSIGYMSWSRLTLHGRDLNFNQAYNKATHLKTRL